MPLHGEDQTRPTYVNIRRLKGQGTSLLHACEHEILGKNCVQKTVVADAGSSLYKEPRLLEQLKHPNIPEIVEAQHDPERRGYITFVMRQYEGGSVAAALLEDYRFSLSQTIQIVRQVLSALDYAYVRHGYVHRDIKSDNVLLGADRTNASLADWELAEHISADGRAEAIVATYHYLAPEAAGTLRHGPEADIYGVGMLMFEMLNGRFRWEEFDRERVEKRVMAGRRSVPEARLTPSAFLPHVPPALVRVVRKALALKPEARYRSAQEFIRALDAVRLIDWRHPDGDDVVGSWEGTWPPRARVDRRDVYRVTSRVLQGGRHAGSLRVVSDYRRASSLQWRRFGVDDVTWEPTDRERVRQLFREVEARAAQRRATS